MDKEHLDHPPTPEELAAIYMHSEENNPQSILYKRTLIRPKVPVLQLVLFAGIVAAAGICAFLISTWLNLHFAFSVLLTVAAVMLSGILLAKRILIALIKTYQALAPKKVRERCRYEPSCSVYMIMSLEKYGLWRGLKKGLRRWRGCKPPNGGFDFP
jgi:putative membrane protein insertion efficiency factor